MLSCPDCSGTLDLYSMEFMFLNDDIVEPTERFLCDNCKTHWVMKDGALSKLLEVKAQ